MLNGLRLEATVSKLLASKDMQESKESKKSTLEWLQHFNSGKGIYAEVAVEYQESEFAGKPGFAHEKHALIVNRELLVDLETKKVTRLTQTWKLSPDAANAQLSHPGEPWAGRPFSSVPSPRSKF